MAAGEHPTTKLCLQLLTQLDSGLKRADVMDYGAGSGVLAIGTVLVVEGFDSEGVTVG